MVWQASGQMLNLSPADRIFLAWQEPQVKHGRLHPTHKQTNSLPEQTDKAEIKSPAHGQLQKEVKHFSSADRHRAKWRRKCFSLPF